MRGPWRDCTAAHHHAAVCGGPGAHPAVWPGGCGQPVSGSRVWHTAHALVLRLVWRGLAQTFAFTPIALHDHARRGAGRGAQPGRGGANPARQPAQDVHDRDAAAAQAGLANAFLVGFIESMADFGNPIVVGGQFSVLSTEIFFAIVGAQYDQGRAASLAWCSPSLRSRCLPSSAGCWANRALPPCRARAMRALPCRCPRACAGGAFDCAAVDGVHPHRLPVCAGWRLCADLGRDYTITLNHFRTAFNVEWGEFGMVWAGTAWNSFFTTIKLAAISAPLTAALGIGIAWLLARTEFRGRAHSSFQRCWPLPSRAPCWA